MGGKIIPRIRLTSAKDLVEVEAELGNKIAIGLTLFQISKLSKESKFDFLDCLINLEASGNSGFFITNRHTDRHLRTL